MNNSLSPLKDISYYRTGGACKNFYAPTNIQESSQAMATITESQDPFFFLGAGSNSLVMDEFFPGSVLSFHRLRHLQINGNQINAGAGVSNSELAEFAWLNGLQGVAWMNGLPGQLGGTTRMNARCYGGEISQVVVEVITVDKSGNIKSYKDPQVFRGYKDTVFMNNNEAIVSVTFNLSPGNQESIRADMDFCIRDREAKDQFLHPSCGCVFKNNYQVGVPSGMLLEAADVYNLQTQNAFINPKHANFVFNCGASSREILELTLAMRQRVYEVFGVALEYEMEFLGNLPDDLEERVKTPLTQLPQLELLAPLQNKFQQSRISGTNRTKSESH